MDSNCNNLWDCDCCHNELNLDKLCVKKARIKKACIGDLNVSGTFCATVLSSPSVCADQVTSREVDAQSACLLDLNASNACLQNLTATNVGVSSLVANDLCVPGQLKAANLLNCGKYRATAVYGSNTSYTLGSDLNFNVVTDDPNSNMAVSPTQYFVPLSGYYLITLKLNVSNLLAASLSPILGIPVANPEIYVNGVLAREALMPFLSFFNGSKAILDTMISLKQGDVVTLKYNVVVLDQSVGVTNLAGSVEVLGSGSELNNSLFKIHLLSVDCASSPCAPSTPCTACTPMTCVPCMPSSNCDCGCSKPPMV